MEIIITLLLIAAVAFVVYFQLKGSRPEPIPVQHLSTKTSPKKVVAQKKEVVEQWDPIEVSKKKKAKKTDDESPKKKKKQIFDPVAEGKKVLKSETLKKRETVAKADEEKTVEEKKAEKQARNRLAADGFVVIDEKKPKAKKSKDAEEAAPVEKVVEEAPLSEFEERLKRLRDVVSGTRPAPKDGDAPYKPKEKREQEKREQEKTEEEAKDGDATDVKKEKSAAAKSNEYMQRQIAELREKSAGVKNVAKGGIIKTTAPASAPASSAPSSGKRGWEKIVKKAPEPEPEQAAEEEAAEEPAAEEPAAEEEAAPAAAEEEWGPVETEEF